MIENVDYNENVILSFHDVNAYNERMTAASTSSVGFVKGIESPLFVKPQGKQKTLIADSSKLLLAANSLKQ